jgi:hypothetical protein
MPEPSRTILRNQTRRPWKRGWSRCRVSVASSPCKRFDRVYKSSTTARPMPASDSSASISLPRNMTVDVEQCQLFVNGRIFTSADGDDSLHQALLVKGRDVVCVGTEAECLAEGQTVSDHISVVISSRLSSRHHVSTSPARSFCPA